MTYKNIFLLVCFCTSTIIYAQEILKEKVVTPPENDKEPYVVSITVEGEGLKTIYSDRRKSPDDKKNLPQVPGIARIRLFKRVFNFDLQCFSSVAVGLVKDKKNLSLSDYTARNVYVAENNNERIVIETFWETEEFNFSEKIIKYKNLPEWVFVRLESDIPFRSITFYATASDIGPHYNLNTVFFNSSGSHIMGEKELPKSQPGDYALCYANIESKSINTRALKKFIIFSDKEIEFVTIMPYTLGHLIITPKKECRSISLGFSASFDRSDVSEERQKMIINDFFNRAKEIKEKMESIDWSVKYTESEKVKKLMEEIDKYSDREILRNFLEENGFYANKVALLDAIRKNDYRKIIDIEDRLKEMKEKMYEILIEDLKK